MKPIHYIGAAGAIMIVTVSIFMNAVFGFSQGQSLLQHIAFATVCIAADLIKVFLPWPITFIWQARQYALAGRIVIMSATLCLWLGLTAWSVVSSFGFSEQSKSTAFALADHENGIRKRLANELERLIKERRNLRRLAPPSELEARAVAILNNTITRRGRRYRVGEYSNNCTRARQKTKKLCARYQALQNQIPAARTYRALNSKIEVLSDKLAAAKPGIDTTAQTKALQSLTGNGRNQIQLALTLLMVCIIELGSTLGPYLAFSIRPGRRAENANIHHRGVTEDLERFYNERIYTQKGARTRASELYEDFSSWCHSQEAAPLSVTAFGNWLTRKHPAKSKSAGIIVYHDIVLRRD